MRFVPYLKRNTVNSTLLRGGMSFINADLGNLASRSHL